jgi:hypothetical protein
MYMSLIKQGIKEVKKFKKFSYELISGRKKVVDESNHSELDENKEKITDEVIERNYGKKTLQWKRRIFYLFPVLIALSTFLYSQYSDDFLLTRNLSHAINQAISASSDGVDMKKDEEKLRVDLKKSEESSVRLEGKYQALSQTRVCILSNYKLPPF